MGARQRFPRACRENQEPVLRHAATLDHLNFDIVKFQRHLRDNRESKVYLSKKIAAEVLNQHQTSRSVVEAA
jgi:hypothetical protein